MLVFGSTSKFFPIHKEISEFLIATLGGILNFPQFMKKMEKWVFWI